MSTTVQGHGACAEFRRFPSPGTEARTEGYPYAARAWDVSLVQGPFPVRPLFEPLSPDSQLLHRCSCGQPVLDSAREVGLCVSLEETHLALEGDALGCSGGRGRRAARVHARLLARGLGVALRVVVAKGLLGSFCHRMLTA